MYASIVFLTAALAAPAEPSPVEIGADSSIRTTVIVAATPEQVRARLADPVAAAELCDDVIGARVVGASGDCSLLEVTTRGLTDPLVYTVKRCPTADGWQETLVASDDFSRQDSRVRLEAVPGGTRIVMEVRSEPRLPLPQRLLQSEIAKSTVQTLRNLVVQVTGR